MSGPPGSVIEPDALREALARRTAGRGGARIAWGPIHWSPSLPSTQDRLSDLEREGAPAGTVLIAGSQQAGRGRRGRSWESPPGLGLYLSALLRPVEPAATAVRWSLASAVACCETLRAFGARAEIKWPNDLLVEGRKAGGVLVETRTEGAALRAVLLGCGLNVGQREADFPVALTEEATSLVIATGCAPPLMDVAESLLARLSDQAQALREGEFEEVLGRWRALSPSSYGTAVVVIEAGRRWDGVTRGISEEGALLVEDQDGSACRLRLGEEIRIRTAR